MTEMEVATLIAWLYEQYPSAAVPDDPRTRVRMWADVLSPFDSEAVMRAARAWVRGGHAFMPNTGDLCALVTVVAHGALPSESEAWMACTSRTIAATLHPVLQRVVAVTGGVSAIAWMDERDARRAVRSAYWGAVQAFTVEQDPEMREAPMSERRLGEPTRLVAIEGGDK